MFDNDPQNFDLSKDEASVQERDERIAKLMDAGFVYLYCSHAGEVVKTKPVKIHAHTLIETEYMDDPFISGIYGYAELHLTRESAIGEGLKYEVERLQELVAKFKDIQGRISGLQRSAIAELADYATAAVEEVLG